MREVNSVETRGGRTTFTLIKAEKGVGGLVGLPQTMMSKKVRPRRSRRAVEAGVGRVVLVFLSFNEIEVA